MTKAGFLVWNPRRGLPTVSHETFEVAVKESERLAQLNPGQTFFVMAPVGHSLVEEPRIFQSYASADEIPF